jgi:hypothetical protein
MENTNNKFGLMTKEVFEARKTEFLTLRKKLNTSKGFMGGLNKEEYSRLNSLHSCMLGCEAGKEIVLR